MEFFLSNLENEKWGKFENLRIQLPLFDPSRKSKLPLPISDKDLCESIIGDQLKYGRELWEEDDDDEICKKLRRALIELSLLDDVFPPKSPEHTFLLKTIMTNMTGETNDDIAKMSEEYEVDIGYKHFVKRQSLIVKIIKHGAADEEMETARLLFPAAASPLTLLTKLTRESEREIPNLWSKISRGNDDTVKLMSAAVLSFESDEWEEETLNEIQSLSTSLIPILEAIAGLRNVEIQGSIRESYLFQRLLNRFAIASRALRNLTHLKENIESGRVRENTLLRLATTTGTPLDKIIERKVVEMKSVLKDMGVIGRKLEKTFPADENVFEYLEILEQAWDAQLLGLPHLPQFQHLKPKLAES